jgi:hypothetical protein
VAFQATTENERRSLNVRATLLSLFPFVIMFNQHAAPGTPTRRDVRPVVMGWVLASTALQLDAAPSSGSAAAAAAAGVREAGSRRVGSTADGALAALRWLRVGLTRDDALGRAFGHLCGQSGLVVTLLRSLHTAARNAGSSVTWLFVLEELTMVVGYTYVRANLAQCVCKAQRCVLREPATSSRSQIALDSLLRSGIGEGSDSCDSDAATTHPNSTPFTSRLERATLTALQLRRLLFVSGDASLEKAAGGSSGGGGAVGVVASHMRDGQPNPKRRKKANK